VADRTVIWKALADFDSARKEARKTQKDFEDLKRSENDLNESTARSSAKADAQDRKNLQTKKEETSVLRQVINSMKDYASTVEKSAKLARDAGGAQKAYAKAQAEQTVAARRAQDANDRLAKSQENLARTQQSASRDLTTAATQTARARNQAERAAISLMQAEQRLQATQQSSGKNSADVQKAELSLADARLRSSKAAQELETAETRLQRSKQRNSKDSDNISRAERRVADAIRDVSNATETLEKKSRNVDDIFSTISASGGGLGGIIGTLGKGFAEMGGKLTSALPMLLALAAIIPVIASAINVLISGIAALGAAAVALTAAIAPAIGVLGALPGAIAAAGLAMGTLMLAFQGVGDAVKESIAAQKNAGKVAKDSAKAQRDAARQVQNALRSLRNAREQQSRGAVAAARSERNARESLAEALQAADDQQTASARNLISAHRQLADAQDSSRRAQINLTKAREDAVRNLRDLKNSVEELALQEDRSALSVEQAKQRLQEILRDPNATDLEKRDAELAVKEAMAALRDTKQQAEDTRKEYAKAQKQGVEHSDAVVQAKKDEVEAIQSVKEAQQGVADAVKQASRAQVQAARSIRDAQENLAEAIQSRSQQQRDAAEAVAQAQQGLSDAYANQKEAALTAFNATEKLRQAMQDLSPEGQAFVRLLLKLKPVLDGIRHSAEKGLFPGLGKALETFAQLAPIISPAVQKMGESIARAAQKIADLTKTPLFRGQLTRILDSSVKIMDKVGVIIANLVTILMNVADAARPFTEWLADTAVQWTEQWKAMTSGQKNQKKMTAFFEESKAVLKVVAGLIWDFAKAIYGIGKASKGVGKDFLTSLSNAARDFSNFVNSKEGQDKIRKWFEDMAPIAKDIADAVVLLAKAMIDIANDPGTQDFWDSFAHDLLPLVVGFFKEMGAGPANDGLNVLIGLFKLSIPDLKQLSEFIGYLADLARLLPDFNSDNNEKPGWAITMLSSAINGINPIKLSAINDLLGTLKKLIQWFSGDDKSSGGGGSWGDESPLGSFGKTIDWLWGKLKSFLKWLQENWPKILLVLTGPFAGAITWVISHWSQFTATMKQKFNDLINWLKKNWPQLLTILTGPLGLAISKFKGQGDTITKFFQDLWATVKRGAHEFVDGFTKAMDGLRKAFSDPVSFVVNTVINGTLIDGFNALANKITGGDSLKIEHITPPQFAYGGVYPGYTPGKDIGMIGVSGGEAIMRPEWTRAIGGKGEVDRMNAAARRGGRKGVLRYLGGFKNGGNVEGSSGGGDFAPTSFRGKRMNYRTIKMLLAAERLSGKQFAITQGSYSTSVAASGGTHAGGGVLDLGWTGSNTDVRNLRRAGFAAWHRNPLQGPWRDHMHIVAMGDPTESPQAKAQVASYLAGGNGLGGTDDGPRVAVEADLAHALGITDADVAAAQKQGGGSLLSRLFGWVKSAAENPIKFFGDKLAGPVQNMFDKFGHGAITNLLSKVPEKLVSAMADKITGLVGDVVDAVNPFGGGGGGDIRKMVQQKASAYGWGDGANWDALQWIINKESSWNPNAQNPNSSAYGLFQFLDGTWGAYGGKTSDPGKQTDYGLSYIKGRYGSPSAARSFHESHGWYADGGVVPQAFAMGGHVLGNGNRDTVPAMLTPGEYVIRKDVAQAIGRRRLDAMNRKSSNRKPNDLVQAFHAGGPVLGIRRGMTGTTVRALRYLLNMPTGAAALYGKWDTGFDRQIRQPDAWKRLSNTWKLPNRSPYFAKLANYMRSGSVKSYAQGRDYLKVSDAVMMKVWEGMRASTTKTMPKGRWAALDQGYRQKRGELYGYAGVLNKALGLGLQGQVWNGNSRAAMKHVLEHTYGQAHNPLEYRPWLGGFTPVENAAANAQAATKKLTEFNGALETLATWGLTDLVQDLLDQGVDQGYNVALSAAKNKTVATILNGEIKKQKAFSVEDQANILKLISIMAGSATGTGLRDTARGLGLSDLATVTLFEKASSLGRLGGIPASKLDKLKKDIASFRAGTFYAATGGEVPGTGSGDTVPAMLTPGEYVLRAAVVRRLGVQNLHKLNAQKFATGGLVTPFSLSGRPGMSIPSVSSGSAGTMNWPEGTRIGAYFDIDIHNPVAEKSSKSGSR
jgi:hypothetical protein